jgi:hypothetical protein
MKDVVIVSGVRTAVGSFGGTLKDIPVVDLGAAVLKEALKKVNLKPVASKELVGFEPDALKGKGMIELRKRHMITLNLPAPFRLTKLLWVMLLRQGRVRTQPARP